jgi:hypothetical protein
VFDENDFPFSQLHSNAGAQLRANILLLPPMLCNSHGDDVVAGHLAHGVNPVTNQIVENNGVQVEEISEEQDHIALDAGSSMEPVAAPDLAEPSSDCASSNRQRSAPESGPISPTPRATSEFDTQQAAVPNPALRVISRLGSSTPSGSAVDSVVQEISTSAQVLDLPVPVANAHTRPHQDKNWKRAMDEDFFALQKNKTWHLVLAD